MVREKFVRVRAAIAEEFAEIMRLYRQLQPDDPVLKLNIAWSEGCYKAMLQTGSRKAATHAFYRSCGFSADEKKGYVARPNQR